MFKARSVQQGGEFAGFQLTRPENGDQGRLYGLELNWQQTLASLPGFGVMLNYTLTDSQADLPFGVGQTDLPGTSKHSYNAALNLLKRMDTVRSWPITTGLSISMRWIRQIQN